MCSLIPNEKFPKLSNDLPFTVFPLASRSLFSNVIASSPRIVTATPIGSPFLTPQSLYAALAKRLEGFFPEICL